MRASIIIAVLCVAANAADGSYVQCFVTHLGKAAIEGSSRLQSIYDSGLTLGHREFDHLKNMIDKTIDELKSGLESRMKKICSEKEGWEKIACGGMQYARQVVDMSIDAAVSIGKLIREALIRSGHFGKDLYGVVHKELSDLPTILVGAVQDFLSCIGLKLF